MNRDATQMLFSCQFSIGLSHNTMVLLCYNDNRAASPWRYSLILMCVMLSCANIVGVVLRCSVCCFVVTRAFRLVARLLVNDYSFANTSNIMLCSSILCRHNTGRHKHPRVDENLPVGVG